jgi:hypothetical protein
MNPTNKNVSRESFLPYVTTASLEIVIHTVGVT